MKISLRLKGRREPGGRGPGPGTDWEFGQGWGGVGFLRRPAAVVQGNLPGFLGQGLSAQVEGFQERFQRRIAGVGSLQGIQEAQRPAVRLGGVQQVDQVGGVGAGGSERVKINAQVGQDGFHLRPAGKSINQDGNQLFALCGCQSGHDPPFNYSDYREKGGWSQAAR